MPLAHEKPTVESVLQSSTLLNALTPEEMRQLKDLSRVVRAEKGEVIWLSGSDVDFFGLASTGFVKMVRSNADGTDVTAELMGPGQIFGMMGTITHTGCPLSAVAVTDLWYLRVPKRPFLQIYESNVAMKDRLVRRLTNRLHSAIDLMARMSSGRVEERIAAILFILSESYGERNGRELTLRVPLTRQEISEMAGTTVESTIRVMSRWQKE
ncbi:MAG TPA: Crp/Fnr family transcriptional regulator, partial [Fimbriimonadaceae bacterium]|nr:Crp/Fnr family transcriptional regulator [Fimbriimonadaceae bacterium]